MTELDDAPVATDTNTPDAASPTEAATPDEPVAAPEALSPDKMASSDEPIAQGGSPVAAPSRPPNYTIDLLSEVEIEVTVELGRRRLSIGEVTRLDVGSVIELDTLAGEPLVVYANGRKIATGEVVVVNGTFGVRIQDLSH
ncbi:MAG: hypothetical protein Rubg2KO_36910 [Rubricoccaceae bacterium]